MLITVYKAFIEPVLENIIYHWAHRTLFRQNTEAIQYNLGLTTAGALRESTGEKTSQELAFKSLQQRSWCTKLCCLFTIITASQQPGYLF